MFKEKYLKYKTKYLELQSHLGGSPPTLDELKTRHSKAKELVLQSIEKAKQSREKATQMRKKVDELTKASIQSREAEKQIHVSAIQRHIIPIIQEVKSRILNLKKELVITEKQLEEATNRLEEASKQREAIKQLETIKQLEAIEQLKEAQKQLKEAQKQLDDANDVINKLFEEEPQLDPPNLPILEVVRIKDLVINLTYLINQEENVLSILNSLEQNEINQFNKYELNFIANLKNKINTEEQVETGELLLNNYLIMNKLYSSNIIIHPTDIFYTQNNFIFDSPNEFKKNVFVVFNQIIYNDSNQQFSNQQQYIASYNIFPVGILINYLYNNIYVIVKTSTDYSFLNIWNFLKIYSSTKLDELKTANKHLYFKHLIKNLNNCLFNIKMFITSNGNYIHKEYEVIEDNINQNIDNLNKLMI